LAKKKKSASKKDDKKDEPEAEPKLQCLEVDTADPLSQDEWKNLSEVVGETQGLGWFQVLPVGQKSSMPYQFNMLHILPQVKIPVTKLPLDVFVSNQLALLRKKERSRGGNAMMTSA